MTTGRWLIQQCRPPRGSRGQRWWQRRAFGHSPSCS
uniref:Uncharacterized protein n=1 Tax=Arundo donax TaxID=35708 RepID=A0A0A9AVJ5_ARUDO